MSGKDYVAAIDIGTHSAKAAIYDVREHKLYSGSYSYDLLFPRDNEVEQDPAIWVRGAACAFQHALEQIPTATRKIGALCVTGTNGLVLVDDLGNPVYNAVMFSDRRAEKQVIGLTRSYGQAIEKWTGNRPAPGSFSLPLLHWFQEEEPEIWAKVRSFLAPAGYVTMKLTGRRIMDTSRASMTLLFNQVERRWWIEMLQTFNIPLELLPQLFEPWEAVGDLTPEGASILGIEPGAVVLAGCVDTVAACIGLGNTAPGCGTLILGTTGRVVLTIDTPHFDGRFVNQCHAVPRAWICTGATNNAGGSLKWFVTNFGQAEKAVAERTGISPFELMDAAAACSSIGSNGVIYLPYLSGERSPIWNSHARGVFFGLSDHSTYGDIVRSVLEGVAFSFRDNLAAMESATQTAASDLFLGGGGSRSRLWTQILADVLNRTIIVPKVAETETLGGIILAGCKIGIWSTIHEAVNCLVVPDYEVFPREHAVAVYQNQFELFKSLYEAVAPLFEKA